MNQSPRANDFINHVLVMKPPQKPKRTGLESSWVGEHVEMWGQQALGGHGARRPLPGPRPG